MCAVVTQKLMIRDDKREIAGWMSKDADVRGRQPLIVICHGFGSSHIKNVPYALRLAEQGFACYSFDFCGGGPESESSGSMLEMSVLTEAEDLNLILDTMRARNDIDPSRIFLIGKSQGGLVSAYVASKRPGDIRALALLYPAFSLPEEAAKRADHAGHFPERMELLDNEVSSIYGEALLSLDVDEIMRGYEGDVLIIHGLEDGLIPIRYSRKAALVYRNAEFAELIGQDHGFEGKGLDEAIDILGRFLGRIAHLTPGTAQDER